MFSQKSNAEAERLSAILKEYEVLAHQSPEELRLLIPSQEVWRFFIDGVLQEKGRGLSSSAYFDSPHLGGTDHFDYTVKEYAEKREKIQIQSAEDWDKSSLRKFLKQKQWHLSDEACEQLTLHDLRNIDKAWLPFEINEPGYLRAMYVGFREIFDFSAELNLDYIKKLHQLATQDVKHTKYDDDEEDVPGDFRVTDSGSFGLVSENTSEAGFVEIMKRAKPYLFFSMAILDLNNNNEKLGAVNINYKSIEEIRRYIADIKYDKEHGIEIQTSHFPLARYCESYDIKEFIAQIKSDKLILMLLTMLGETKNENDLAKCLYQLIINPPFNNFTFSLVSDQYDDAQEKLNTEMQENLERYQESLHAAATPIEKLLAIIEFVQSSDQLHPFVDANVRSFCMLLLNHLLMQNGFPPAILDNPNHFDAYSKSELLVQVLKGMENTLTLTREKTLFNVDTNQLIKFLESKKFLEGHAQYFQEATMIEESARRKMAHTYKLDRND